MAIEERLLAELGTGAVVSAVAGAALGVAGRRGGWSGIEAFGRQTVAWAAVDGALAAGGWAAARRRAGRPGAETDPDTRSTHRATAGPVAAARARTLRRLLLVNAFLDVGYLVLGAALVRRPARRGDGAAILVQGGFLLWLDTRHARRFGALAAELA